MSVVVSNLFRFGIQLFIFFVFYAYYYFYQGVDIGFNKYVVLFPVMIVLMGMLGLGLGMIISSLVTKYRDIRVLMNFGVQLLMYLSAVMYPISFFEEKLPEYTWIVKFNPLTYIIETVRFVLLDIKNMQFDFTMFGYSIIIAFMILFIGIIVFNKAEKNFIDTV